MKNINMSNLMKYAHKAASSKVEWNDRRNFKRKNKKSLTYAAALAEGLRKARNKFKESVKDVAVDFTITKETEKAVCVKVWEESTDLSKQVWLPKSMMTKKWFLVKKLMEITNTNGGYWSFV